MSDNHREIELDVGISLKPVTPVKIEFRFRYKGKTFSYTLLPNEVKIIDYKQFILIVRNQTNGTSSKLKWATVDTRGDLIEEGEI